MLSLKDFGFKAVVFVIADEDHLRFANENLVIVDAKTEKIKHQIPLIKTFAIFIVGHITITSVLLEKAAQFGCSVIFMRQNYKLISYMGCLTEGNTLLRLKQFNAKNNEAQSRLIVINKMKNQAANLKKIREKNPVIQNAIIRIGELTSDLEKMDALENASLLGIEGNASKIYFGAYFKDIGWKSRKPRAKIDEINTLLDIGYTFLFNYIEANLKIYGFDVYYGFYHRLFFQRKSLVSDIIEPFRCIVEHCIRNGFHLGKFKKEDFIERNQQYILRIDKNKKYTQELFSDILQNKEEIFLYIREYYRFVMKEKEISEFPEFSRHTEC